MKRTGKWVPVVLDKGQQQAIVRMLHTDTQGRPCVRMGGKWWAVAKEMGAIGDRYIATHIV